MGTPSYGAKDSILAFDTALPFDAASVLMLFDSETMTVDQEILQDDGLSGTRSQRVERTRFGKRRVSGQVTFDASPIMLDQLLYIISGTTEAADVFALAQTLPSFYLMIAKGARDFTFNNCICNRASFKAEPGGKLKLVLDLEAESFTNSASGTLSAIGLAMPTDKPFQFSDLVGTTVSAARDIFSWETVIDHKIDAERWVNAVNRANLTSMGRDVLVNIELPFSSSETDLVSVALAGSTGSTAVYTNADATASVLTFTYGALQFPASIPVVNGKGEIRMQLKGRALRTGSTLELSFTNAHA